MGDAIESIYKGNVPVDVGDSNEPDMPMNYMIPCLFMRVA